MCIVIDACDFSSIVNTDCSQHVEFAPLYDWIVNDKGKIVYGGSKYEEHIRNHGPFRNFLSQYEHKGKTLCCDKDKVDIIANFVESNISSQRFDDSHIIAIVLATGCKLICSSDQGLSGFVSRCYTNSMRSFLSRNSPLNLIIEKPKIYKRRNHRHLLCDNYIAVCCK